MKKNTKNVSTTILVKDYSFLKNHNLQVSAALSVGVQTLRNIYEGTLPKLKSNDVQLIQGLIDENRAVLKRLGESE